MQIKFRHLEVFKTIMEVGSMTEAATTLRVTQPAVSKTLKEFEDVLGFPLFRREHGRLAPTSEARVFLSDVAGAFSALDAVERVANDLREARVGVVRIAATPTLAHSLVPYAVERFQSARPNTGIVLYTALNVEVVQLVVDLRVDIGLVLAPTRDSATLSTDLCAADLVCLLPVDHPLTRFDTIRPRDLDGLPLITYSRIQPIGELIEAAFERSGSRRVLGIEITQSAAACAMVNAGVGVALVDAFALIAAQYPNFVVRPFRPKIAVRGRLLQARMRPLSRLGEVFAKDLQTAIKARLGNDPAFEL